MKNDKVYDVAIIGAGIAGISCAIQLKRQGLKPLLFEKAEAGGLLRNANLVENYPGFPQGLSGKELVGKFKTHLESLNINPIYEEVIAVTAHRHPERSRGESPPLRANSEVFKIQIQNSEYSSRFLVVASGTNPKKLDIKSVFYEVCELYKQDLPDKTVVIVGSGDAAFDYALNLVSNSDVKKIIILNRNSKTKCLEILKEKILKEPKITYIENEEPAEFSGQVVLCRSGREFKGDYLLAATGRKANTAFIDENIKNNTKIFFIGDVKNGNFRQSSIAAGDGIKAAMEISSLYTVSKAVHTDGYR